MTVEEIQDKIDALELALASRAGSAAGTVSVTIDGVATTYSFDQAVAELAFWEGRLQKKAGTRKCVRTIDLRNT
jgi:hypothetical protein